MKKIIEKLKILFISKKSCEHGFEISEVINIKMDPTCKKCGKALSILMKDQASKTLERIFK